jgi:hypothetical protein
MDVFASIAENSYEYTSLKPDEIRFMVLHPGITGPNSHRDQRLRCTLLTLDEAQRREYDARSYVWSGGNHDQ